MESAYQDSRSCNHDFQLEILPSELVALIGDAPADHLHRLFGERVDVIKMRRVQAKGQCINFHIDHAARTMQVPLNPEEQYKGGRLLWITERGLVRPPRPAGSASIHTQGIVHGVSTMEEGIRCGLFFLQYAPPQGVSEAA
uniref:Prolyl 4-hydroxylase alpha subunit Fe(2+) 2OG dioxygenase domain-containing protein n=1 Tax=Eutreptiella gymnastica TaxID=73025 RepID=A0A7S1NCD3_9EUGL